MKLYCDGLDLSDASLKVSKALTGKSINPILEGIKLTAKEDKLILFATDTSLSIEKVIKADVVEEGEIVVIGKTFVDFVKTLEGEQVELSCLNDGQLTIKYSDSDTKMNIFPSEEYPEISKNITSNYFTIKTENLKKIIDKTLFACAQDGSRPILNGCLFEVEENSIKSVALDGYRMVIYKSEIIEKSSDIKVIVPQRTLSEIVKLLGVNETVTVFIEKNNIKVDMGETKLYSSLIEGNYIEYKNIIPKNFNTHITVNKQLLENSISRASIVARSAKNNLASFDIVKFDVKDKYLTVSSSSEDGEVKENIPITMIGKDLVIGFSCKRVLDYLRCVDEDFINLDFISPIDPCIIKPNTSEDYFYLLLPVKMQ